MLVQVEVMLVSVPVISILRDSSTDGRYIGFAVMLWVFPMSTLVLIMVPKVLAFYRGPEEHKRKRGELKGVQVTGLNMNSNAGAQSANVAVE